MDDGFFVPGYHDGMAAFQGPRGATILVRNHEVRPGSGTAGPFGAHNRLLEKIDRAKIYDAGFGVTPGLGGTTTLVYDTRRRRLERHFLSLAGTWVNCAGGRTPWNSWITCEEIELERGSRFERDHGFAFEVPASDSIGLARPEPLKAMGRFQREAVAVDPRTGIVYQTEDQYEGLLYRFIPTRSGRLIEGGRLQALRLKDLHGADTSNWNSVRIRPGQSLPTEWVDLEDVESPRQDLRLRGHTSGAAVFHRAEGMLFAHDAVYFACTDGGYARLGQIWRYDPSPHEGTPDEQTQPGRLELFVELSDRRVGKQFDNMTVAPWGDLIVCEDADTGDNRLLGVTPGGLFYPIASNQLSSSEFAGPCFSPDGDTLFVNMQKPGLTLAITGVSGSFPRPSHEMVSKSGAWAQRS
jgi:uncharacterized protein